MKSTLPGVKHCIRLLISIIFSFLSFTGHTQCVAPSFPAPASILATVPEAANYNMVYSLPIPSANQAWASPADVPYGVNNSVALQGLPFARVAYYLKLESIYTGVQWVWVSMDAFTSNVSNIGIPAGDAVYQQTVSNMNVLNNAGANRAGVAGNIEFWSSGYEPANTAGIPNASATLYDFGDQRNESAVRFGSFQVHDYNKMETLFAYNGWATPNFNNDDLGIGNCGFCTHPDFTFAANAQFYDVKELYVFVSVPRYQPACKPATLNLDASGNATLSTTDVTSETIGQCGLQSIALSQTNFTCANLGANTVTVTFTVNGIPVTCQAMITVKDLIKPVQQVSGTTLLPGCDPGTAAIEAALGNATATDNCGSPTLQVSTSAIGITANNREQTRTWTATDASKNVTIGSRTVKWTTNCIVAVPDIYPSDVSCSEFRNGASPLLNVCYQTEDRKVKKVSPENFYYYATVTAPPILGFLNILTVDVVQTKSCAGFKLYEIQDNQVRVYDANCKLIARGFEVANGQGRVIIFGATPGRKYTISVNYETKSLEGSTYSGNTAPVCSNTFITKIAAGLFGLSFVVPGSQGSILAKPDCYRDPADDDDEKEDDENSSKYMIREDVANSKNLHVEAYPNPTATYFTLKIEAKQNDPVSIRVIDVLGRNIFTSAKGIPNTAVRLGDSWKPGIYFVEIQQGVARKIVRLIKQ